jgi:hypothetical protein
MTSAVVRTPKLTDGEILSFVVDLLRLCPEGVASVDYPLGEGAKIASGTKLTQTQLLDKRRLIQEMKFSFGEKVHEIVAFHRGVVEPDYWRQHPNRTGFLKSVPNAHFDELGFLEQERTPSYGSPAPERDYLPRELVFEIASLVNSKAVDGTFVGEQETASLTDIVLGQVHELRSLHLEMTRGLAEARLAADAQLAKRTEQLDAEYGNRASQLAAREGDLEARKQELNDREPQHERRRLREHLTARLQTTIAEPRLETGKRERFSYYLYLAVGAAFVMISVMLAIQADVGDVAGSAAFWSRSIKSVISGIAGAAFAWAGLAGLKSSAVAARQYEQAIQRYAFDMDRASWIVETILQMNSVEEATVPDEWLEAVCRDLFAVSGTKADDHRSLEAFAALFDATARARIGTTGVEFEIDRKGAKKLADL